MSLYKEVDPLWIFSDNCGLIQTLRQVPNDTEVSIGSRYNAEEVSPAEVEVWPNPASNSFQLRVNSTSATSLQVVDRFGRIVWRTKLGATHWQAIIDVANWPSGLYTVHLFDADEIPLNSQKLIILP